MDSVVLPRSVAALGSTLGCSGSLVETVFAQVCNKPSESAVRLSMGDTLDILDTLDTREAIGTEKGDFLPGRQTRDRRLLKRQETGLISICRNRGQKLEDRKCSSHERELKHAGGSSLQESCVADMHDPTFHMRLRLLMDRSNQ